MRTTTLARGHDDRIALSIAAQRAGQGMSARQRDESFILCCASASAIERNLYIGLLAQGVRRVSWGDDAPTPATARLSGGLGIECRRHEEDGGLDRL